MTPLAIATGLLGGIGLFLLGMRMMTDGLKLAAGESLKEILGAGTRTPARALLAGGLVTALVQSSSAVTVATIGFVNAGVLDLARAIVVVFGSNVGTTMTGWIVALLGVRVDVGELAVPLVGIGALLRLLGRGARRAALGDALAGFGLFFLGIGFLRNAFGGLGGALDVGALAVPGLGGIALFVALGIGLTALTQSSSAALTITLTAAAGGVIPLANAAAAAIGTNVGTTSTAGLAAIGATPNARRVAAAHVIFNLLAGAVALATLPLLLLAVSALSAALGLEDTPVTAIALFHTAFNVLGVALIWPFRARLVALLGRRFRSAEEKEATPRYLDHNVAETPDLALAALVQELARTARLCHRLVRAALEPAPPPAEALAREREVLESLFAAIARFAARAGNRDLPDPLAAGLAAALRTTRYQREAADLALELAELRRDAVERAELARALDEYERGVARVLDVVEAESYDAAGGRAARDLVDGAHGPLRAALLLAAARGEVAPERVGELLDRARAARRLAESVEKAARGLAGLRGGGVHETAAPSEARSAEGPT